MRGPRQTFVLGFVLLFATGGCSPSRVVAGSRDDAGEGSSGEDARVPADRDADGDGDLEREPDGSPVPEDGGHTDADEHEDADGDGEEIDDDHETAPNRFGVWLWYLEQLADRGITSHGQLARRLSDLGVRRIYVKVADGDASCDGSWPEACDESIPDAYHEEGLECWAWSYNYPAGGGTTNAGQAAALRAAAEAGYDGYVLDLEVEFDYATTSLEQLLEAFTAARADAVSDGAIAPGWPIYATTWGNPADHGMRVDIIDAYVDGHMPQTYLEVWGDSYMADGALWVQTGTCEYRSLGAVRPVHHILSTEHGRITASQLNGALASSTAESSLWRVPGAEIPEAVWATWEGVDWSMDAFATESCP